METDCSRRIMLVFYEVDTDQYEQRVIEKSGLRFSD